MRFKDRHGRSGIALHLDGQSDETFSFGYQQIVIRDISKVFVVFKRFTNANMWLGGSDIILNIALAYLHNTKHAPEHLTPSCISCINCPSGLYKGDMVNYITLFNFLAGNDPFFSIAQGYVPAPNLELPRINHI